MSGKFMITMPSDVLVTAEQLEAIAEILRTTERLRTDWVGKSDTNSTGYQKKLVPTDLEDSMTLKYLTESDYNAYRFIAANAAPTV
jgi:hypothetical protein